MSKSLLGWINMFVPKDAGSERIAQNIAYGSDPRQKLDIYRPKTSPDDLPIMFFIYGGGWDSGAREDYEFVGRMFAAMGYLTIIADYRLVPEIHYPVFMQDCAAALNWSKANAGTYGGDANRLFVSGHSAGAYNAVMLALAGERFGVEAGSIKGIVGLSGPYDFYPFDVAASIAAFGQWDDPESTQPVNLVSKDAPPMFLGHGSADPLVYPRNAVVLARKLRAAGNDVVERHYRGLDHPTTLLVLLRPLRGFSSIYADVKAFLAGLV